MENQQKNTQQETLQSTIKVLLIISIGIFMLFPMISAYVIYNGSAGTNVLFRSIGLNSSLNITFQINFSRADVRNNSITFYNLTYRHPSSCGTESIPLYNLTSANLSVTTTSNFTYTSCIAGAGGGGITTLVVANETGIKEYSKTKTKIFWVIVAIMGSLIILFIIAGARKTIIKNKVLKKGEKKMKKAIKKLRKKNRREISPEEEYVEN